MESVSQVTRQNPTHQVVDLVKVPKLSTRQQDVLKNVFDFINTRGCAPTLKEIASMIGVRSRQAADSYVRMLLKKGCLARKPTKTRKHAKRSLQFTNTGLEALKFAGVAVDGQISASSAGKQKTNKPAK